MEQRPKVMPLSKIQSTVLAIISENRNPESHLAGATGIHMSSDSLRVSHDLDLFHDRAETVAQSFKQDHAALLSKGFCVEIVISQPGFIRAQVKDRVEALLIDWAQDSIWRFFQTVRLESVGWVLHPVDLAVNKVLALIGRDEPRDFVDTLYVHQRVLPLGALIWAAAGKDPGLNPRMLLELLRRKGRVSDSSLRRLDLRLPINAEQISIRWREALGQAEEWFSTRPLEESGCLYTDPKTGLVFAPEAAQEACVLWGQPGGVLPQIEGVPIRSLMDSPEICTALESFFQKRVIG